MLKVKRLRPGVKLPTIAHPGSDLGFDLYLPHDVRFLEGQTQKIPLGVAVELERHGFLMQDRSSLAARGIFLTGGVIDAGYRGELHAVLTLSSGYSCSLKAGDKVAQLVPVPVIAGEVAEVTELSASDRGEKGFGSSGR
ncbi:MAG: dUTP diphosphatase [Candidatus Acidiferrales bacterium]